MWGHFILSKTKKPGLSPGFFNGVFLMVNYIIAKHHKKVNKIL